MGYALLGGDPVAHRAFAFYGEGRNGKSTLLDVILELLGKENVSAISMKNLDKPFSAVMLDGKMANIVEESPTKIDAEAFKNIVSGGYVTAAHKGKPEYDLKVNARLFFACNKLPIFRDSTVSIKDRLIFVPFVNYIKKHQRDTGIKARLGREIEGILNFAIEGLDRYLAEGFTEPRASEELMHEYQVESDAVFAWADEFVEVTFDKNDTVMTRQAYNSYLTYCVDARQREASMPGFSRRFASYLRNVFDGQSVDSAIERVNQVVIQRKFRGWCGIKLKK
jgi:putative DNA primase/helicase